MSTNAEIIRCKTREEWLKYRCIGSSEIATIAGVNPYESRYELWQRKLGLIPPKQENEAMMQGHEIEDYIAQMFARHAGKEIIKSSAGDWMFRDKAHPWRTASPDRTYWIDPLNKNANDWTCKGIAEMKSTERRDVSIDNVPNNWYCQVQWQMGVGGMNEAYIAWLLKWGCKFDYIRIEFNSDVYEQLADMADEFYLKNIQEKIAPVEMRADDIKRIYPVQVDGTQAEADNDLIQLIATYHKLAEQADAMASQIDEIKDKVIVAIGANEKLVTPDGVVLATYKAPKSSLKFDAKALKADAPDVWAKYATEQQASRRLLIK